MTGLALLAIDPVRLRGATLRARVSPQRDIWMARLAVALPKQMQKIGPDMDEMALFGGLDVSATLASGAPVHRAGLLEADHMLLLANAERARPGFAARIGQALDDRSGLGLVMLDEGTEEDAAPATLMDRAALWISLEGVTLDEARERALSAGILDEARNRLEDMRIPPMAVEAVVALAGQFGISSQRPAIFSIHAARAHAALMGRSEVSDEDVRAAFALVLGPRATQLPQMEPPEEEDENEETPPPEEEIAPPEDKVVEAAKAALPPELLERLAAAMPRRASDKGKMASRDRLNGQRGRPRPSRPGRLGGGNRIDLMASLRAASLWQTIRARERAMPAGRIDIRARDIHVKRYHRKSERLLCFLVDASGSAAANRLGEAKGAVELLLAEAYSARDQVTLIAYRKDGAEMLLPSTRSLVQAKRRLAGLPGGGGTPLAHGLQLAWETARGAARRGQSPALVLVAEGRANIALDGDADRSQAAEDAFSCADLFRAEGLPAVVLDMSRRPEPQLETLAKRLGGTCVPMPRADAHALSAAVKSSLLQSA